MTITRDKQHQAQVLHALKLILGIGAYIVLLVGSPGSTQDSPTPVFEMSSLFAADTCAPPCWFGLTVGESTSEDVIQMFVTNPDLFFTDLVKGETVEPVLDPQPLRDGKGIEFWWRISTSEIQRIAPNYIGIKDGIVSSMSIVVNDDISLRQTLEHLGQPSTIRATWGVFDVIIILYYRDQRLMAGIEADRSDCMMSDMTEMYKVSYLEYLSPHGYFERARSWLDGSFVVSDRVWDRWRSGEVTGSCQDAIRHLE